MQPVDLEAILERTQRKWSCVKDADDFFQSVKCDIPAMAAEIRELRTNFETFRDRYRERCGKVDHLREILEAIKWSVRSECKKLGCDDWPEGTTTVEAVEKHLVPALRERAEKAEARADATDRLLTEWKFCAENAAAENERLRAELQRIQQYVLLREIAYYCEDDQDEYQLWQEIQAGRHKWLKEQAESVGGWRNTQSDFIPLSEWLPLYAKWEQEQQKGGK